MNNKQETPIQKVIRLMDGQESLRVALNVKYQSQISAWATGRRPVPPKYCLKIESLEQVNGQVTKHDLRPDVFGTVAASLPQAA